MAATLRLTRRGSFGFELRRGRFEITVDGRDVGSLDYQDTVETPVDPGQHTLRPRYVASFVKPDLAIALMRK